MDRGGHWFESSTAHHSIHVHYVYILQSQRNGRYYIGFSGDVEARLADHNRGAVKATRYLAPWVLAYAEGHNDASSARRRESELKRLKSRRVLGELIRSVG